MKSMIPSETFHATQEVEQSRFVLCLIFINRACFSHSKILRPRFFSTNQACIHYLFYFLSLKTIYKIVAHL